MVDATHPVTFRRYQATDYAAVAALWTRINRELAPAGMEELFERYIATTIDGELRQLPEIFSEARRNAFWVVESESGIVGSFGIESHGAGDTELRRMYLDKAHRGRGIAQRMLDHAQAEARALEMQRNWPERYLQFASINQSIITAAVAFWVGLFCVVGLIFARRRSAVMMALLSFSVLVLVIAMFAIYELDHGSKGRGLAIVTGKDVQARLATADTANSVLALPSGSEVKILSTRGDWVYAALPNNLRGWIPAKDAEQVRL